MPILESEILGSKIEINYQKGEKDKLINLIKQFNNRLLEFNDLKGKFTDSKIILLAALKIEDEILDLNKRLDSQKKIMQASHDQGEQIDNKIREIVILKDEITSFQYLFDKRFDCLKYVHQKLEYAYEYQEFL